MLAGAAVVDITPPLPVDVLGYVRRARAPRRVRSPLQARAVVLQLRRRRRSSLITGDVVGPDHAGGGPHPGRRRRRRSGCPPENVLLNSSHSHAGPVAGRHDQDGRRVRRLDRDRARLVGAGAGALRVRRGPGGRPARRGARRGRRPGAAPGIAVNRRERTPDGRTILGWNPDGFLDEEVPTVRIDAAPEHRRPRRSRRSSASDATRSRWARRCPPSAPTSWARCATSWTPTSAAGPRSSSRARRGTCCPLEAFGEDETDDEPIGQRLALEAAHAVADAEPWRSTIDQLDLWLRHADQPLPAAGGGRAAGPAARAERPPAWCACRCWRPPRPTALAAELAEREADLAREAGGGRGARDHQPDRATTSRGSSRRSPGPGPAPSPRRSTARSGRRAWATARSWARRARSSARSGRPSARPPLPRRRSSPATARASWATWRRPRSTRTAATSPPSPIAGTAIPAPFDPAVAGIIRETRRSGSCAELFGTPAMTDVASRQGRLADLWRASRARIGSPSLRAALAERRTDLPLRYWRQQAHFTTPADKRPSPARPSRAAPRPRVASSHVGGSSRPSWPTGWRSPLDRVAALLEAPRRAPLVMLDGEDAPALTRGRAAEARRVAALTLRTASWGTTLRFYRPPGLRACRGRRRTSTRPGRRRRPATRRPTRSTGSSSPRSSTRRRSTRCTRSSTTRRRRWACPGGRSGSAFLVESGWCAAQLPEIARRAAPRLASLIYGLADYSADLGLPEIAIDHPLADWVRAEIVNIAGAVGVPRSTG